MKLSNEEVKLFYKLRDGLYHFINKKFHIIKNLTTPDFNGQYAEEVARLDDKLSSYPHMVDEFVKENPLRFNQTELNIVSQWKKLVKGDFYILHEKEKSVFLGDESKAYHVYGLQDEIRDILPFEPYMAKTILFPFCGKIVYSSILNGYNMTFGRGMVDALSRDYIKAKSKFGLIESLDEPLNEKEESSEELLRFYLKNENNRMRNWDEIHRLLKKEPNLTGVYHQELSKSNARKIRKRLLELKVNTGYFAVFNDIIITSGETESRVREQLKLLIGENAKFAHIFKYEGKIDHG